MYTVAVTGITGKSGQYFLKRLLKEKAKLKDYEFILLCRNDKIASKNNKGYQLIEKALKDNDLNVKTYDIDLTNVEGLKTFFKEQYIDMLLHIAGIKLSKYVVPAALRSGVDNYILVHTTGIYSKYKAAGEEYRQIESRINKLVEKYNKRDRKVAMTILRPTMIYGDLNDKNVATFIKMVDKLRIFPIRSYRICRCRLLCVNFRIFSDTV